MGYFTYRIFRDVSLVRLVDKIEANLRLYEPDSDGRKIRVSATDGHGCSGIVVTPHHHAEDILRPIAYQFGGIWMDVRYQDGDWWDLSIYRGAEYQEVNYSINPWAHESGDALANDLEHTDWRIQKICSLWPEQAEKISRYLLLWRTGSLHENPSLWVPRKGKAYETDEYEYGNAKQIHDFVRAFGIGVSDNSVEISVK